MKGKITFSKYVDQNGYSRPKISIEDVNSGVAFLEISMSLEKFSEALLGLGYVDCEFDVRGLDKLGKKRESKIEFIYIGDKYMFSELEIKELFKDYETDGWLGREDDVVNPHNRDRKTNNVKVWFTRWV